MRTAEPRAAAPALECSLTAEPPLVVGGPVSVRFTLTNKTDAPLWVLRWNTPLERWKGTIFTVTLDGKEMPYQGPRVKRGDPGRDEYAEIPAGGTAEATVDFSQVYEFQEPGSYQVKVVAGLVDATTDVASVPRPRDLHQAMPLDCPAVTLEVTDR
jgi:hypothetical protein